MPLRLMMVKARGVTRRDALQGLAATGALLLGCGGGESASGEAGSGGTGPTAAPTPPVAAGAPVGLDLSAVRPIAAITGPVTGFLGDEPLRPHGALWDVDAFLAALGGAPAPTEEHDVVVVGGGMSGLASAWLLRDRAPLLLEQAPRFGGNSKGEDWDGIRHSIGAAYFVKPDPQGALFQTFFGPLGLSGQWRDAGEDPVALNGAVLNGFWEGATDPPRHAEIARVAAYLRDVLANRYPDLPPTSDGAVSLEELRALDGVSLRAHLEGATGPLHPHVRTLLEHYCWSSFGGGLDEIGAASGLNFLAAELEGICALPGGNSGVADALLSALPASVPPGHLRPGQLVLRVAYSPDGRSVLVTSVRPDGALTTVRCKVVVLACPKFVAQKILPDLPAPQRAAMDRIRYRAYVVGNALIAAPCPAQALDLYLLGDGTTADSGKAASDRDGVTDVVTGHFAQGGHPERSVLTLYRAYPWDGARPLLYADGALTSVKARLLDDLRAVLPLFGLQESQITELRVARWGHALPLAEVGHLRDGVWEAARAPLGDRILFAEQDDWPAPALETALVQAMAAATAARGVLG